MARTEHYDDPNAPEPNSLVPAASAVVTNDAGEILMQRRTDNGYWALPGGTMDLGETIGETAIREVLEETGVTISSTASSASTATRATASSTPTAKSASSSTSAFAAGCAAGRSASATNQPTSAGSRRLTLTA